MSETNLTISVEYREVARFPGYRFGDDGSVWSALKRVGLPARMGSKFIIGSQWKRLKETLGRDGYTSVGLHDIEIKKVFRIQIHRLILEAFVGECPEGYESCHSNGIRIDNRLSNLRFDTKKNNQADRIIHGTDLRGESHPMAKLNYSQIEEIRVLRRNNTSYRIISSIYKISQSHACKICKNKAWK